MEEGKLEGKVALVTGGSSGIGRAIALRFAKEGAKVLIIGRNHTRLEEVASQSDNIAYVQGDLTDDRTLDEIKDFIKSHYQNQLDTLVNNAGWCPVQSILESTIADFDKAFSLDVRSLVVLTIKVLPLLVNAKGNIINLSSLGASHPGKNLSFYVAAKAAVENLTKAWALDLAHIPVRVNAIAPGSIETNIWNVTDLSAEDAKKHKDGITSTIPMKRMGEAFEAANVALFLASKEASYVTGSIYAVDGGAGAM